MYSNRDIRIAWLLPVAWFYWQPTLSEFTKLFPKATVFTALWPGFAKGFEDTLDVQIVGQRKVVGLKPGIIRYAPSSSFTYVSPAIAGPLLRFKPDIVFTNAFGIWTLISLLLKFIGDWKVIIAYEGSSPGVDFRDSAARSFIRRVMGRLADGFITNSHSGKSYLVDFLNLQPERIFVHPYEVPSAKSLLEDSTDDSLNFETSEIDGKQFEKPIFLFVGRLIIRKGLHVLLDACNHLRRQGYEDYTLLVVGEGEQRQELETFARDNHLEGNIKWIGQVDYRLINAYFKLSDVFILPTLEDTWGVVVLEAMLFDKPILCSTGAGASEIVISGENGYIFEPTNPESLAELMKKFIENPELASCMGEKSKQIMGNYTPEMAAQFLSEVVKLIDDSPITMTMSSEHLEDG